MNRKIAIDSRQPDHWGQHDSRPYGVDMFPKADKSPKYQGLSIDGHAVTYLAKAIKGVVWALFYGSAPDERSSTFLMIVPASFRNATLTLSSRPHLPHMGGEREGARRPLRQDAHRYAGVTSDERQ